MLTVNARTLQSLYGIKYEKGLQWVEPLNEAFRLAEIDTHWRIASCLAQIGHESGRLRYVKELWGPTKQQLRYEPGTTLAKRLGNVEPGDGKLYMGRGLIQTTGRANYAMTTVRLRELMSGVPDFEKEPWRLEEREWAALSMGLFWKVKRLNRFADAGDLAGQTRAINGGYNGLADRQTLYARALILG